MQKVADLWSRLFRPSEHKRDPLPPARTWAEWRMVLWHRLGTLLQAHAYGLEAYHKAFNASKVDSWKPESAQDSAEELRHGSW